VVRAGEEKWWKRHISRKWRRRIRALLHIGETEHLPDKRELRKGNIYGWAKDGKQRFDPKEFPRGMRK
jgi:hypothetical protein